MKTENSNLEVNIQKNEETSDQMRSKYGRVCVPCNLFLLSTSIVLVQYDTHSRYKITFGGKQLMIPFSTPFGQVGSYHATSLLVASRPPTPGVLSRGIGLEGLSSVIAGLWGTGTGSTTLTENVHTIAVTKMGSRRAVEFGACLLIVLSLCGKCFHISLFSSKVDHYHMKFLSLIET